MFVIATLAGVAGCGTPEPDRPTYSRDIKPMMEAHCIRCHGAGGTLNKDPYNGQPIATMPNVTMATNGDFTQLADDAAGKRGLMFYTGPNVSTMQIYLVNLGMPPPPSDKLSQRDIDILLNWCDKPNP